MRLFVICFILLFVYNHCLSNFQISHSASNRIVYRNLNKLFAIPQVVCGGSQYTFIKEIGDPKGSGTGRVYSASSTSLDDSHQSSLKAVIKRSWGHKIYLTFPPSTPAQAVSKECSVLKKLEYFGVPNVPKCIASCYDSEADHTTMIMQPLFIGSKPTDTNPDTSSIKGMTSSSSRITATRKLATTIVQLLGEAHIVTTGLSDHSPSSLFSSQPVKISVSSKSSSDIVIDKSNDPEIQILVNSDSGDILVIDFSESKELVVGNNGLFSEKDLQLADAFLRSAVSLVPKDCITEWQGVIQSYLNNGGSKENKIHPQLKELFHKYT